MDIPDSAEVAVAVCLSECAVCFPSDVHLVAVPLAEVFTLLAPQF